MFSVIKIEIIYSADLLTNIQANGVKRITKQVILAPTIGQCCKISS
jgi:hypothetical protein